MNKEQIIDYILLFIEFNLDDWYEFSMFDDSTGELITIEFDVATKALRTLR